MKYILISGILLLSALKNSLALPAPKDPLEGHVGEIFKDVYENCEKEEGTFYFRDYENSICLKQKSGDVIDFSENTEVVGTNFARKYNSGFQLEDDKLIAYSWYKCDNRNSTYIASETPYYRGSKVPYDHEECMKDASKFRTVENPAGLKFIEELINCESEGNAFYYRNNSKDLTKFDYVCMRELPLDYYHISKYTSIPKNCIVKDKQIVCVERYSLGEYKNISSYDYDKYDDPNDFYKLLVNAIFETESMYRYDLSEIDYESDTMTSVTILNGIAIKNPENVKKMETRCYDKSSAPATPENRYCVKVKGQNSLNDCYNYYTKIQDSRVCHVYTQHVSPLTTTTKESGCTTIATYRTIVGHSIGPNFTYGKFCNTETYILNPYTYFAVYTNPAVEPTTTLTPTPTPTPSSCNHGYPCCKKCGKVYYEDSDATWGIENNDWCEYLPDCLKKS